MLSYLWYLVPLLVLAVLVVVLLRVIRSLRTVDAAMKRMAATIERMEHEVRQQTLPSDN